MDGDVATVDAPKDTPKAGSAEAPRDGSTTPSRPASSREKGSASTSPAEAAEVSQHRKAAAAHFGRALGAAEHSASQLGAWCCLCMQGSKRSAGSRIRSLMDAMSSALTEVNRRPLMRLNPPEPLARRPNRLSHVGAIGMALKSHRVLCRRK